MENLREKLLDVALPLVAFEGWTEATFRAAAVAAGVDPGLARAACPRGAVDLAAAFHRRGDVRMAELMQALDLGALRYRERVATAIRCRLEAVENREAARRAAALFALPHHAPEGARLIWGTADAIWEALGDTSRDVNWYTKRATLAAVYGASALYWLGDDSPGHDATWAFVDRRIDEVMRFEKFKARVRESPSLSRLLAGPLKVLERVKAPDRGARDDLPGRH